MGPRARKLISPQLRVEAPSQSPSRSPSSASASAPASSPSHGYAQPIQPCSASAEVAHSQRGNGDRREERGRPDRNATQYRRRCAIWQTRAAISKRSPPRERCGMGLTARNDRAPRTRPG